MKKTMKLWKLGEGLANCGIGGSGGLISALYIKRPLGFSITCERFVKLKNLKRIIGKEVVLFARLKESHEKKK